MMDNLGDDADIMGSVYGEFAGAYYGEEGIPVGWREKVIMQEYILGPAERIPNVGFRVP